VQGLIALARASLALRTAPIDMTSRDTVFVIDDDPAVRQSLRWILESADIAVEAFGTAHEFLHSGAANRPGCLVLDVRIPGMSGLDLQEQLAAQGVTLPVIVISGHGDVAAAVRAMKAGALDFLEKPFTDEHLLSRVRQALTLGQQRREGRARRAEVMQLVVSGKANKQIASLLGRSPKTVEIHRANVMKKMEVDSLAELVRIAHEHLEADATDDAAPPQMDERPPHYRERSTTDSGEWLRP
jgi:FixJ family two-component response regulator